ncbi:MAG: DUF2782 domain-containing protein [Magnetococcales bacterium]|nr:DUF2782 domain-containing protein [Magnetococcales bacterium]
MMSKIPSRTGGIQCLLAALLFLLVPRSVMAKGSVPDANPIPAKGPLVSELKEDLDPAIPGPETVIRKYEDAQGNQVREFAINGAVFEIQVVPANGPPYYLIDNDGDGLFETRLNGYEPKLVVPQWVLFRF